MLPALIAAFVVAAAPADPNEIPPLPYDLPGKVFAATKVLDPSEPLGDAGRAIPLPEATVTVFEFKTPVAKLPVDANGRFVVPKNTIGTHVEVTAPGREVARAFIHEVGEYVEVRREGRSFTDRELVQKKIDPNTGLLFLLRRVAIYSGRVVDGDGKPLAGATVRVRADEGLMMNPIFDNRVEMVTGRDGAFSLEFAPGKVAVDAYVGDNLCVNTQFMEKVRPAEKVTGLQLVIKARSSFRVRVTHSGAAVENAKVQRCRPDSSGGWTGESAETDAKGIATFTQPVAGEEAAIVARHPIGGIAGLPLTPTPAAGTTIEMKLRQGATVQGFVKTPEGKPIRGVEVGFGQGEALPNPPSGFDDFVLQCAGSMLDTIETNAQGYFRRSDLLHRLTSWDARKDGYEWRSEFDPPPAKGNLQIVMRAVGVVRGRIRRADSGPRPGPGGELIAVQSYKTYHGIATDDVYEIKLPPGLWRIHYVDVNGKKTPAHAVNVSDEPVMLDFDAPE